MAWALRPLAALYGLVVACRRLCFRLGLIEAPRFRAPVVVVGNLIVGGAGKTPTVIAVVAALRRAGWTPGIVSRGYGGRRDGVLEVTAATPASASGDEPRLLLRRTGAPVTVGVDRAAAVRHLLGRHREVDVVVADDGLQRYGLHRDAQVIVFDDRGAGNGWLLPAGPLREPLPRHLPERTLVVYNAARPSTALPGWCARRRLGGLVTFDAWRAGTGAPSHALLERLRGRPVLAAAGIARPERFFSMLAAAGLDIVPCGLPDHHDYARLPWPADTPDVVVTEKDAVKLDAAVLGRTRLWVAPLDYELGPAFDAALCASLPAGAARSSDGNPLA